MYTTSAFARLTGVTVKALRHYDSVGLTRVALFRELVRALDDDAAGTGAQELAERWRAGIDPETRDALKRRAKWPSGMRAYIASLYDATPEEWERVTAFAEAMDGQN
jgi:hypothetical protein